MDFEKRLQKAIVRGKQTRDAKGREESEKAISEDDLKTLHSKARLELSEHIEICLRKLVDHFPGFDFKTVVGENGWGAKISRDDFRGARSPGNQYSRFEMLVRPYTSTHIVELAAKGTVRNKEIFNRTHYQFLSQVDLDSFSELIDLWVLEFAEKFSASV